MTMTPRELDALADAMARKLKQQLRDELPAGRLLDRAGIAAYLGVSPNHIATLSLPSLRLGQRRLYDPLACVAHLEQQEIVRVIRDELPLTIAEMFRMVAEHPELAADYILEREEAA